MHSSIRRVQEQNPLGRKKPQGETSNIHIDYNRADDQTTLEIEGIKVVFPFEPYDCQTQFMTSVIKSLNSKENSIIQCPTGTGKTLSLLCSTLSWLHNYRATSPSSPIIKILYASRTHSQLKQVVKQLKKTVYCPSLVIASSRDHSCCNSQLKHLEGHMKELECRKRIGHVDGKTCRYFKDESVYSKIQQEISHKVMDIEQLVDYGKSNYFCPFFYNRKAKQTCDILLMPYNYLFDRHVAKMYNIDCQNAIVVIDEGHNISYNAEEGFSAKITTSVMYTAIEQLSVLKEMLLQSQKRNLAKKAESDQSGFKATLEMVESYVQPLVNLHCYLGVNYLSMFENKTNYLEDGAIINVDELIKHVLKGMGESKLRLDSDSKYMDYEVLGGVISTDMLYLSSWAIEVWKDFLKRIHFILHQSKSPQSTFKVALSLEGDNLKIEVLCLDASKLFEELKTQHPYNFIITSGTLSPMNLWEKELGLSFPSPLALPNMVRDEQVIAYTIYKGLNNIILDFNYSNRDNLTLFKDLGFTLLEIIKSVPNGVLVLFSSYSLLDTFRRALRNTSCMSVLLDKKDIFFESKDATAFKSDLQKYITLSKTSKGAVFFAVNRGKISEGLDLDSDKCRAVILVGVPYLSIKDKKTKAKKEYLDSLLGREGGLTGNQWYMAETIRNINQSVGRAIRNSQDFAAIYLIDSRFSQQEIINNISEWVRTRIKMSTPIKQVLEDTKNFFVDKNHQQQQRLMEFVVEKPKTRVSSNDALTREIKSIKLTKPRESASISSTLNDFNQQKMEQSHQLLEVLRKKIRLEDEERRSQKKSPTAETRIQHFKQRQTSQAEKDIFTRKVVTPKPLTPLLPKPEEVVKVEQAEDSFSDSVCHICTLKKELVGNKVCSHKFCEECWKLSLKSNLRCPLCRERVRESFLLTEEASSGK